MVIRPDIVIHKSLLTLTGHPNYCVKKEQQRLIMFKTLIQQLMRVFFKWLEKLLHNNANSFTKKSVAFDVSQFFIEFCKR